MARRLPWFPPAVAIVLFSPALAQKPAEMVRLKSGAVHEARRVASLDGVLLATALGDVPTRKEDVAEAFPASDALKRISAATDGLHPDHAAGQFAAAELAAARGLWSVVRARLDRVLAVDPDHAGARRMLAGFARSFRIAAAESAEGATDLKKAKSWCERAEEDWAMAAMAVEKGRALTSDALLRPALKALKSERASARWAGAQLLAGLKFEPERVKPLYRASLVDRSPAVRRESVRALRSTNDLVFVDLYARNLGHAEQSVRMTAGEALGEFGRAEGVAPLVGALSSDGPRAQRAFISVTTQRAYVKDFDVEVAAGAVIADPIVDVVQDGTVLDVGLVAVSIERHVYYTSLRRLTGLSHGDDLNAWRDAAGRR